ncbi:hypothetical protein TREMEDRAFT_39389 [Tremella mesenterica DSM 1558]|uniref:uncharacterized protein n=1 Tax=Tremella mesenterica (strain ATCC 24925 / CBS 8224 / DSM 1558 / NBRC 9311 / NRRL Y-6157 / RJB 2259-6 / UBC 559-6) TaxID=578456 RepID=UPI0003F49277|nr:uncharacterized protein TREMEDRAFT_39389 [Tremella mesenterica DSM 1558]EIW69118.1 hypothetical protein TREMEDRAFT_39389 [Tremella mesenterica DSM 1558]
MSSEKACCTLPPAEAEYTPKGSYETLAGLKTYVVGPDLDKAKGAVLCVYDIFGFSPQILQGADLLSAGGFKVYMPDFCAGEYATAEMFSGTPEGNAQKAKYFGGFPGRVDSQSKPVADTVKALKELGFKSIGGVGYCWGYKCLVVSEGAGLFHAIVGAHPSFAAVTDADPISSPLLLLPSQAEDIEVMNAIAESVNARLPGKASVKAYPESVHGFAAARANLHNEVEKAKFHEAYTDMVDFFCANL